LYELSNLPVRCKCGIIKEYCHLRGVAEKLAAARGIEVKEPVKRSLVTNMLNRKTALQNKKTKKTFKDYLCMPFGWKRPIKKKDPHAKINDTPVNISLSNNLEV